MTTIVIKQTQGRFPYVVEITIEGKMYITRTAVTQEHAAIIAGQWYKKYPDATLYWQ